MAAHITQAILLQRNFVKYNCINWIYFEEEACCFNKGYIVLHGSALCNQLVLLTVYSVPHSFHQLVRLTNNWIWLKCVCHYAITKAIRVTSVHDIVWRVACVTPHLTLTSYSGTYLRNYRLLSVSEPVL